MSTGQWLRGVVAAGGLGVAAVALSAAPAVSAAQQEAATPNVRDATWSPDGRLMAFVSDRSGTYQVYVALADGSEARRITTGAGPFYYPSFSPDGSRLVAMAWATPEVVVWTMNVDGSNQRALTPKGEFNSDPRWSADGTSILFSGRRGDESDLYVMSADGSGRRPLLRMAGSETNPVPSPDGSRLLYVTDRHGGFDLAIADMDGRNDRVLTADPRLHHLVPKWSPDGRRIAYYAMDREAGPPTAEVFVLDVATGERRQVTRNEFRDQAPAWSPDGKALVVTSVRDGRSLFVVIDLATLQETPVDVRYAAEGRGSGE